MAQRIKRLLSKRKDLNLHSQSPHKAQSIIPMFPRQDGRWRLENPLKLAWRMKRNKTKITLSQTRWKAKTDN